MCVGTGAYVEDAAGAAVGRSDRVDKGVGEFIIVEEGVEFPRPKGRISLSVRGYVVGGFVAGLELRLQFRRSAEFG